MSCSNFFQNKDCEYFPCHDSSTENFNCLFCYCPLYSLGEDCGGNFYYLDNGVKCCEKCTLPHSEKGYEHIQKHISEIIDSVQKKD